MYLKFGAEQASLGEYEWRFIRQVIADHRPGWTMEYIDNLSIDEVNDLFAVKQATRKANEKRTDT